MFKVYCLLERRTLCCCCSSQVSRAVPGTLNVDSINEWDTKGMWDRSGRARLGLILSLSVCSVAKSYLTLCNPKDCSSAGSSVHGISQGRNTQIGCYILEMIFPTQGSNPCLLLGRQTLYYWARREAWFHWEPCVLSGVYFEIYTSCSKSK